jgi:hypothetical protein
MPVGVKIFLVNLHLQFFFIVDLVKDRGDVIALVYSVLGGLCPKFVSYSHTNELEHDFVILNATMGRIMSEIDDEEVGNESSDDNRGGLDR